MLNISKATAKVNKKHFSFIAKWRASVFYKKTPREINLGAFVIVLIN